MDVKLCFVWPQEPSAPFYVSDAFLDVPDTVSVPGKGDAATLMTYRRDKPGVWLEPRVFCVKERSFYMHTDIKTGALFRIEITLLLEHRFEALTARVDWDPYTPKQ